MKRPDLSVILVSHNDASYLRACLDSLAPERHAVTFEVFLVDNVSTDETVQLVRAGYPWVHLLENTHRQGFAANNNRAIRASTGSYVLLLNPDTQVLPEALERLVGYMDAEPRVGLCGPQLTYPDGRIQLSCRRFPTLGSVLVRRTALRVWLRDSAVDRRHLMADTDHGSRREVDWLLGACLAARRELLRTVGLLDPGYYLYVEDIDWAYRAWQHGWRVGYCPEARVVHHHQASSDKALFSRHSLHHLRSMWRYYRKHLAPSWLRLHVQPDLLAD